MVKINRFNEDNSYGQEESDILKEILVDSELDYTIIDRYKTKNSVKFRPSIFQKTKHFRSVVLNIDRDHESLADLSESLSRLSDITNRIYQMIGDAETQITTDVDKTSLYFSLEMGEKEPEGDIDTLKKVFSMMKQTTEGPKLHGGIGGYERPSGDITLDVIGEFSDEYYKFMQKWQRDNSRAWDVPLAEGVVLTITDSENKQHHSIGIINIANNDRYFAPDDDQKKLKEIWDSI